MAVNLPNLTEPTHTKRAIGSFPDRRSAEQALHDLRDSGFQMDRVSIVAKDAGQDQTIAGADVRDRSGARADGDNKADDGAKTGAVSGGALGGLTGLLVGIGALAIPGIGPIMLAGAAATALATTAAGSAIGAAAGGLLGGLVGMGIPEDRAKAYNDRVSAGEYLVMVDGIDAEIDRAHTVLSQRGIRDWGVYDAPATARTTPVQDISPMTTGVEPLAPVAPAAMLRTDAMDAGVVTPPVAPLPIDRAPLPPTATDAESIRLYEERLVADKHREKTGEVGIGKRVEVETARVSVPIEKERVVIERVTPGSESIVTPGEAAFGDTEAIRVEVYEESPDIRKEAFVREEVSLRKEVTQETVNVEETLRREELKLDTQGHPVVDSNSNPVTDDRR